jgi:hypothetical protein
MNPARLGPAAAVLVCLVLIGCGDDEETTVTETAPATTSAETTGAETQATASTSTSEEASTSSVKQIAPGKRGPKYFETPSQNIGCYVDVTAARCDIRERSWEPPEIPKACVKAGVDYGQGIAVGKDGASFVCAGDTALGGKATLGYGQVAQRGVFRCKSAESGVTCSNIENGAGFFISREKYRIF